MSQIAESQDVKKIVINADEDSKINSEIFDVIKNTDKQLVIIYKENEIVFNGKNIKNSREIDASIFIDTIKNDKELVSVILLDGIVVNFAPNGDLPGIAKVRIKNTDILKSNISGGSKVYVYFYDELNKNFMLLSENVKLSDDEFYEFAIEHNSKYILVNEEIDEKLLVGYVEQVQNNKEEKEVVSFLESHKVYIMIIVMCVIAIIFVSIIVFVDKKGITKRKMMAQKDGSEEISNAFRRDDK